MNTVVFQRALGKFEGEVNQIFLERFCPLETSKVGVYSATIIEYF